MLSNTLLLQLSHYINNFKTSHINEGDKLPKILNSLKSIDGSEEAQFFDPSSNIEFSELIESCNSNEDFEDDEDFEANEILFSKSSNISCCETTFSYNSEVNFDNLVDYIELNQSHSFKELLFKHIDEKNLNDAEVYKQANIDRKLFSKIRCNKNYKPSKSTIISLGLALKLNKDQTEELLESVGYTLSNSSTFDLIICFCIEHNIFNIMEVNYALEQYNCVNL